MLTRTRAAVLALAALGALLCYGYEPARRWLSALVHGTPPSVEDPPTPGRPHFGINLATIADWSRECRMGSVAGLPQ